jgi:ABC-type iron transport system FetAB ATPase subunit
VIQLEVNSLVYNGIGPFTFSIAKNECLGLSGPSGSGKSLMLRALADIDPHDGRVALGGIDATKMRPEEWRRRIGLLPAESHWWGDLVKDHFHLPNGSLLQQVGFDESVLNWSVSRLSSGEKQRLAIVRLLANEPKVLLLDEPTANLDQTNTRKVEELFDRYQREHQASVFWVAHDLDQLRRVAHRGYFLDRGQLLPGDR